MEGVRVRDIAEAVAGDPLFGDEGRLITGIAIDSRRVKAGDLFVPLVGERVDGHDYIKQSAVAGADLFFTERQLEPATIDFLKGQDKALIKVADSLRALQLLGGWYRSRFSYPLVGVTGSVGKTSTREMIATALSAGKKVFCTKGNHNSQVGLPLTLCDMTEADIGVLELGMSEADQLAVIARLSVLSAAVITNVGIAHIEQLGTRENICNEKMSIQEGLLPKGKLFLNGDDEMLKNQRGKRGCTTIYYGTGPNCEYRGTDITWEDGCPSFTVIHKGEGVRVKLNVMGYHNVLNALVALAVAHEYGIPLKDAGKALSAYRGFKGRQQLHKHGGIKIIDDSYNASPDSMRAGIEVLDKLPVTGRKMALLADMMELGEEARRHHYDIGRFLSEKDIDELVTVGSLSREIARGLLEQDPDGRIKVQSFDHNGEAIEYIKTTITGGDGILIKGSHSMNLAEVVDALLQE